jgi:hypothetical protein
MAKGKAGSMRRALVLMGLVSLGVLVGFLVRLVWPRQERLTMDSYRVTPPEEG